MQGRVVTPPHTHTHTHTLSQSEFLGIFQTSCLLSSQQPSPYIPSPVSSLPVPHPSVSLPARHPPVIPMSSINSFPSPLPPGPTFSTVANLSTAPPAVPSFSDAALSYAANSGPVSASTFSCTPVSVPASICTASGPAHSSVSVVPSSVPVVSLNCSTDPPLRFTFDELNLPDLYASFKSLVKTMRERGGSQCK